MAAFLCILEKIKINKEKKKKKKEDVGSDGRGRRCGVTSTDLAAPKWRVWGRGSAQLEERENVNKRFSLRLIWRPNWSK
jgi:hypothetical protein